MFVLTADYASSDAAEIFVQSLKKTGFAVLKNHPVPYSLIQAVYDEWANYYRQEDKFNQCFDPASTYQGGYFPFKSENAKGYDAKNLMEYYHYYIQEGLPEGFSDNTEKLFKALFSMAEHCLQWIQDTLPDDIRDQLSEPLPAMVENNTTTVMRIIHYAAIAEGEDPASVRAAAHEDIDLLTVLVAATTPGLQVQDLDGNWHPVECEPGNLVFNAGDMLQMATGGYFKSTTHRVINPEDGMPNVPRYSVPLFVHPRNEVVLSDQHTAGSYLRERLTENGLTDAVPTAESSVL